MRNPSTPEKKSVWSRRPDSLPSFRTATGWLLLLVGALLWLGPVAQAQAPATEGDAAADEKGVDHAGMIGAWDEAGFKRGQEIYRTICMACHGTPTQAGSLPAARAFWKEPFKNGSDPLSLYRTLGRGLGQMPAWPFLSPQQRYDVVHYVREAFVKPSQPAAYFAVTREYLAALPKPVGEFVKTAAMLESEQSPRYLRMEFGQSLFWTLQVETNNIAYKGIAIRVDPGAGGVSRGHAWMLYDHDTMRVAAGWSGDGFVDWKGIAFDGTHQTHTSIAGRRAFVNPVGPGWANPANGSFADPRFLGRDGKPYGPLPREWVHYQGIHTHSNQVAVAYTVGGAEVLEAPGYLATNNAVWFARRLELGKSKTALAMRIAPAAAEVRVVGGGVAKVSSKDGFHLLEIAPHDTVALVDVLVRDPNPPAGILAQLPAGLDVKPSALTHGGPSRWNATLKTTGLVAKDDHAFVVDTITHPPDEQNPWHSWMRISGFDFLPDGSTAAVCTWLGDVWLVRGIDGDLKNLEWKRIASGLFQPLGLKLVNGVIHVGCRDQIARLHDLSGDGEVDFIENFNNDHQVTEHFHEFAMGLQTDSAGNFYYAKSARHALPDLVPQHGTLLRVSPDGGQTEIVASGFRAANGVCVNDDGTFFVTDQEGHWTPKNRINLIRPGKFYGNMWSYYHPTSSDDALMEQPLVWITNDKDRSPGEIVRVTGGAWNSLRGSLLNLSYGTGRIFLVPHERIPGREGLQGGVVELPIPDFPTGVMRGRFHPANGQLYAGGMYAWAGNRQEEGGFYRVRHTGLAANLPVGLHAATTGIELTFTDPLDPASAGRPENYQVKAWSLKRSAQYGSQHVNEHPLAVKSATLSVDRRTVRLGIPAIEPTWCMEVRYQIRARDGAEIRQSIHNTVHGLGAPTRD